MSGGHFNDCGYGYYKVSQFADELEQEIEDNFVKDDFGYSDEVIGYLKEQLPKMRKMAEIMRHIDYLYSGDHGEDSFMKRVKEVEKPLAPLSDSDNQWSLVRYFYDGDHKLYETIHKGTQNECSTFGFVNFTDDIGLCLLDPQGREWDL